MPEEEGQGQGGGGFLAGLLAPLRLPERALEALDVLSDAARGMKGELTRVREQTEQLGCCERSRTSSSGSGTRRTPCMRPSKG